MSNSLLTHITFCVSIAGYCSVAAAEWLVDVRSGQQQGQPYFSANSGGDVVRSQNNDIVLDNPSAAHVETHGIFGSVSDFVATEDTSLHQVALSVKFSATNSSPIDSADYYFVIRAGIAPVTIRTSTFEVDYSLTSTNPRGGQLIARPPNAVIELFNEEKAFTATKTDIFGTGGPCASTDIGSIHCGSLPISYTSGEVLYMVPDRVSVLVGWAMHFSLSPQTSVAGTAAFLEQGVQAVVVPEPSVNLFLSAAFVALFAIACRYQTSAPVT
jgi:hypothetical protein